MLRPALRIKVPAADQREIRRLLSGGIHQVRVVLRARAGRETIRILLQSHDLKPWRKKNVVRGRAQ
jgi:hypothetical protein